MQGTDERLMWEFIEKYLDKNQKLKILDLGSWDRNGSFRPLFDNPNWSYLGADIQAGDNVDLVMKDPYDWGIEEQFDVVISGNTIEHIQDLKRWVSGIPKVLKSGGFVVLIAPFVHGLHKHPYDCWRIVEDGMRWLVEDVCGFELIRAWTENATTTGIGRKK